MSTEPKTFKVKLIQIHNIMGIVDAEIRPGALTLVEGKNGLGKTSLIEACKLPFMKGHKATLLREGETTGEVVYTLDDGTGPPYLKVSAKVKAGGTERTVGYPGEAPMGRPAEVIGRLRSEFTLFPTDFLTKKKDERLELFLSAIPMKVNRMDLAGILPLSQTLKHIDLDRHAFKVLADIEENPRTNRTAVNAIVNNNRKTVLTMRQALPEESLNPETATKQLAIVKHEYETLIEKRNRQRVLIADSKTHLVQTCRDVYQQRVAEAAAQRDEAIDKAGVQVDLKQKKLEADTAPKLEELKAAIMTAETNLAAYSRSAEARALMEKLSDEADAKERESQTLTNAIDVELAELRSAMLEQVPIKGVSVRDGDIFVTSQEGKEIPFDSVNTKERIRVAVDLALLKAGPVPLVCMDGAEALDAESLDELQDAMEACGAQCIASRVTEDPKIKVTT